MFSVSRRVRSIGAQVKDLKLLGASPSEAQLKTYSTTSIRVGNQVLTEEVVRKFRAQRNRDNGWVATLTFFATRDIVASVGSRRGPGFRYQR